MKPYYEDDLVTLYLGDCLAHDEWLAGDVLVMDPPYGINWKIGNHPKRGSVKHDGIANDGDTLARDHALARFGNRPGIVFGSWRAPAPTNVVQALVWRKPADAGVIGSTTGFRLDTELIFLVNKWPKAAASRSSVLSTDVGKVSYLNGHPHAKPVALMQTLIEATRRVSSLIRLPDPDPRSSRLRVWGAGPSASNWMNGIANSLLNVLGSKHLISGNGHHDRSSCFGYRDPR